MLSSVRDSVIVAVLLTILNSSVLVFAALALGINIRLLWTKERGRVIIVILGITFLGVLFFISIIPKVSLNTVLVSTSSPHTAYIPTPTLCNPLEFPRIPTVTSTRLPALTSTSISSPTLTPSPLPLSPTPSTPTPTLTPTSTPTPPLTPTSTPTSTLCSQGFRFLSPRQGDSFEPASQLIKIEVNRQKYSSYQIRYKKSDVVLPDIEAWHTIWDCPQQEECMRDLEDKNIVFVKWEKLPPEGGGKYDLLLQVFYWDNQGNRQWCATHIQVDLVLP